MDYQQLAGGQLAGHAGAVGLGRQRYYALDVGAGGAGGDDYRAAKGMADYHHRPIAAFLAVGHPGQQVEDALQQIVGKAVIQSQRGYPLLRQAFRHAGVGSRPGAAETAPGAADPDYGAAAAIVAAVVAARLYAARLDSAMDNPAELAAVGVELQPGAGVAFGQGRVGDPE